MTYIAPNYGVLNSYLLEPTCSICQDRGESIEIINDIPKLVPCPNCPRGKARHGQIAANLRNAANLPLELQNANLGHFSANAKGKQKTFKAITRFIDGNLPTPLPGLVLRGALGVGKTTLMAATLNAIISQRLERVYFVRATEMVNAVNAGHNEHRGEDVKQFFIDVPVLGIDELGVENVTPATKQLMEDVIRIRLPNHRPTIMTTNYTQAKTAEVWGDRTGHYLGGVTWVDVAGEMFRTQYLPARDEDV